MCGIIGIVCRGRDVIEDGRLLLNAENNRGEQCCGAAVFDGRKTHFYCGQGRVAEVFGRRDQKKWSKTLRGFAATLQTLYSTVGNGNEKEQPKTQQPVSFKYRGKLGAVSHNGNLVRLDGLRKQAKNDGYRFKSETSDTEVIAALLSTSKKRNFLEALIEVLQKIEGKGAFTLVILYQDKMYGVNDPNGIRPLCIIKKNGRNSDSDSYILASESSVYPSLEATRFVRDVDAGELVVLGMDGIEKSIQWTQNVRRAFCISEFIYFMNPASRHFGVSAYAFRVAAGAMSARNHPSLADVVIPVPESGRGYSDGFSSESGISAREGLIKSRYPLFQVRTFTEPREVKRTDRQRTKMQANPDVMEGRHVCLVEDSVFRAGVAPSSVRMSREYGKARAVDLRVCSPLVKHPCHLGLDTATANELVGSSMTVAQIRDKIIHCDSLEYLSVEELEQVLVELGLSPDNFCFGCFTGKYPVRR